MAKKLKWLPGRVDAKKQEKFAQDYRELRVSAGQNAVFYFDDGRHPRRNSLPACGFRCGTEVELKSSCSRENLNNDGFLNIDTHKTCVDFPETMNAQNVITLFKKWISRHPENTLIYLLSITQSILTRNLSQIWREKERETSFSPRYLPNVNPIESLWNFFKKKGLSNRHLEKFCNFKTECKHFFHR